MWVIGFENTFANRFEVQKDYARYFNEQQQKTINNLYKTGALVYAIPNPDNDGQTLGFVGANIKESIPGLARLLPHYGKYSWLGFEGSRPNNVLKGTFSAAALAIALQHSGKRTAAGYQSQTKA